MCIEIYVLSDKHKLKHKGNVYGKKKSKYIKKYLNI